MKAVFTATALVLASASGGAAVELSAAQLELLTRDLNDPESARVRNVTPSAKFDSVLCGEVNWKNRNGGYDGYRRFWIHTEKKIAAIDPSVEYGTLAADFCGG